MSIMYLAHTRWSCTHPQVLSAIASLRHVSPIRAWNYPRKKKLSHPVAYKLETDLTGFLEHVSVVNDAYRLCNPTSSEIRRASQQVGVT
jgi:hypothetical protein